MKSDDPSFELKPLVPPEPLLPQHALPQWGWYAISGGILVAAVLAVLAIRFFQRKAAANPVNVRESAYRQALATLDRAVSERVQETTNHVSAALRLYLARVSGDPALYETHEEFISRHQALSKFPEDLRTETSAVFSELARLKYGKEAQGDPAALVATARGLLEKLHSAPLGTSA